MTSTTPHVECEMLHPSLAVNDVLAAAEFYENKLGFNRINADICQAETLFDYLLIPIVCQTGKVGLAPLVR